MKQSHKLYRPVLIVKEKEKVPTSRYFMYSSSGLKEAVDHAQAAARSPYSRTDRGRG